ncbi:MogA/MoaB family molybdenum cofactor biosynthesis protein [Nodosilinea sp. LEGE 07088]|uniref:MogA/MoaB family molybdenum cofactor biosynthesis protein n=1 Tax=Nodosilinea sp. LEGE 07088 TaxID=2777968 RepID=UPI00187FAA9A|nr:MogA/MoaB family molybdenum cofactor biosynthesis protein [Nodosilinea sp. LEGE 07088]MBE9136762.1 MogA/MoaB family molybdenum cofactor biosynthesis protein [Nodosilinea sp. LEGE 07088]
MAHPQALSRPVRCAVVTVSDTRTVESDRSGQIIQTLLAEAGQQVVEYRIVPDEPDRIAELCQTLADQVDCIMLSGGTGIAPRDTTYDAVAHLLEKTLPGFGEIFRQLSFQEIGSRAIASRAVAGVFQGTLIFSLPGSSKAVTLAMNALILPELPHLVSLMQSG